MIWTPGTFSGFSNLILKMVLSVFLHPPQIFLFISLTPQLLVLDSSNQKGTKLPVTEKTRRSVFPLCEGCRVFPRRTGVSPVRGRSSVDGSRRQRPGSPRPQLHRRERPGRQGRSLHGCVAREGSCGCCGFCLCAVWERPGPDTPKLSCRGRMRCCKQTSRTLALDNSLQASPWPLGLWVQ